jgi:hypothetical protein
MITDTQFEEMQKEIARLSAIVKEHQGNWEFAERLFAKLSIGLVIVGDKVFGTNTAHKTVGFAPKSEVN